MSGLLKWRIGVIRSVTRIQEVRADEQFFVDKFCGEMGDTVVGSFAKVFSWPLLQERVQAFDAILGGNYLGIAQLFITESGLQVNLFSD